MHLSIDDELHDDSDHDGKKNDCDCCINTGLNSVSIFKYQYWDYILILEILYHFPHSVV